MTEGIGYTAQISKHKQRNKAATKVARLARGRLARGTRERTAHTALGTLPFPMRMSSHIACMRPDYCTLPAAAIAPHNSGHAARSQPSGLFRT